MNTNPNVSIVEEDTVIVREGEVCGAMYKILHGKAALYINYGKDDEYIVGIMGEQKCFGEVSLLSGKPNPYTVVAVEKTMLVRVSSENFESFIKDNVRNIADIMKNLANYVVMLSTDVKMMSEEMSIIAGQLEELQKQQDSGGKNKQEITLKLVDITEKIKHFRAMAALGQQPGNEGE